MCHDKLGQAVFTQGFLKIYLISGKVDALISWAENWYICHSCPNKRPHQILISSVFELEARTDRQTDGQGL